ncbi:MAG TPA: DUF3052 family protein [Steroidobacteraceae bacterium]|jgi:hypothetical protein|nr:DUF3052 family protein [Steroidobacteraceae bacterium]
MSSGYSGTPLAKKLGFKPGQRVSAPGAPPNYRELLAPLPEGLEFQARVSKATDVVHLFTASKAELARILAACRKTLGPEAAIWVSWPKKAAKMPTDITEDTIRDVALPMGLVDIKVCAVDDTWSGLKLVLRKELRPK